MPPTDRIVVRPAVRSDVPRILGFIKELAEYERLSHQVTATESQLDQWLFGDRPVAEVLIGELNGAAVGFALFFLNFSTFLAKPGIYLEDLYVQPAHRGKGVGAALFRQIAHLAVERGCGRLEWAVLDWNQPAIGFYQKLGAVAMNDWTVYRLTGETLTQLADT